ncbi:MAG: response regulator [Magnetococcales bacterium]|nr:response regulator [Magnetococcales bacterium]
MHRQKHILIVDDDARNRKLMETLLHADGYTVQCVQLGAEALASVAITTPDLILLDLMMPGMDGFEVVRRLKADDTSRNIPIVMVTALGDESSRARLATAGVCDVLIKPISRWDLKNCLDKILGGTP